MDTIAEQLWEEATTGKILSVMIHDHSRKNLLKLADYLEGDLKANFSMLSFSSGELSSYEETDCGSVGCAIGHGPHAGIPKKRTESWAAYCSRVFTEGVEFVEHPVKFKYASSAVWDWCFSQGWADIDNTAQGAARRIRWFLDKSAVPDATNELLSKYRPKNEHKEA